MKRDYLGDSYDAVKRLWCQLLAAWAPLHADPQFLPEELQEDFQRLTGIPPLPRTPPVSYSLLNDPDTGIRLPRMKNQRESRTHISLTTIADQLQRGARCVVTFDQGNYRNTEYTRAMQRQAKLASLREHRISAFYYVSHAPFPFAFPDMQSFEEVKVLLIREGIPAIRLVLIVG